MALDRNPNTEARQRRNWQRLKDGGATPFISVTPPLQNSGAAIFLSLDAGGGLENNSGSLRAKLRDTSLTRDASGLGVALRTTPGLQISSGLGVLLPASSGLELVAGGLKIDPRDTSLTLDASGAGVALATNPGLEIVSGLKIAVADTSLALSASGAAVNLATDPGLEVSSGVRVKVVSSGGIERTSGGLRLAALPIPSLPSSAVASTVAETAFNKTITIPANTIRVGSVLIWSVGARYGNTGTPTLRIRARIGGTVIADTGSQTLSGASGRYMLNVTVMFTSAGASASYWFSGVFELEAAVGVGTPLPTVSGVPGGTIDTTAAITLDATAQWSVSDPANTATMVSNGAVLI